jgi:hypothetical protein
VKPPLLLFCIALFVDALSIPIGVAFTREIEGHVIKGYLNSHWAYLFPILLPLAYWLLTKHRVIVWNALSEGGAIPKMLRVGNTDSSLDIRNVFVGREYLYFAFSAAFALNVVDYQTVAVQQQFTYTASAIGSGHVHEPDWTLFSQMPGATVSLAMNTLFNFLAYSQQFLLTWIALALFGISIQFNIGFVRHVWLRSRQGKMSEWITLDLSDDEGRFGYRGLGLLFTIQVLLLGLAGTACLFSRVCNVDQTELLELIDTNGVWELIFAALTFDTRLFPDLGQIILVLVWIGLLFGMLLPAIIKLLPLRRIQHTSVGAEEYLKELFDDETLRKAGSTIGDWARNFRKQSFWPGGQGLGSGEFNFEVQHPTQ